MGTKNRKLHIGHISLKEKLFILCAFLIIPFSIIIFYLLYNLNQYCSSYDSIVRNITQANEYNVAFKEDMDEVVYQMIARSMSKYEVESQLNMKNPDRMITDAEQTFESLKQNSFSPDAQDRLSSVIKLLITLRKRVNDIDSKVKISGYYDENMLPDDRKAEGIIDDLSVRENIILALQAKGGMFRQLPKAKQEEIAERYIDLLQIKTPSMETPVRQLSGGNQQKVILARWLATDPEFLILDEPTRGIDIGTKAEIQKLIIDLAQQGRSILFISSEISEMLRTCNRMVIMRDGAKVNELSGEMTQEKVMQAIAGGEADNG